MELEKVYFFTATIHNWLPLLRKDSYKEIIISSLKLKSSEWGHSLRRKSEWRQPFAKMFIQKSVSGDTY
jgi:hypothetical protein